jgi:hypothetical protein
VIASSVTSRLLRFLMFKTLRTPGFSSSSKVFTIPPVSRLNDNVSCIPF